MRTIMSDRDRKVNAKISQVKSGIKALRKLGYKIEVDRDVETMFGTVVDHIYTVDRYNNKVTFQKYLFSPERR